MTKLDLNILQSIVVRPVKSRKRGKGNYARHLPSRRGKGLWMKDAFDLVIAKNGCQYGAEVVSESDAKVEGIAEEKKKRICNECLFLEWNEERGYYCTNEV